ncbi:dephospho-CoA kinase [Wolbachia endosymbiont of Cruorifilaria tuberocauda]|uniref:dephospho-CoA kinase n=1 Tax=Wolbachia endosymbiont of Cruorifilaria tuberocauda TaxID=1812111 RepID=UPI001588FB18|nr:dephospho-CoA kinase [Wolbachia endosymbiont of Cruorifilaria tuberocauda]QKX01904.1 dephospho-CoA kinase [Wolbachia endosymbiont of Cruorifilaria tuberocauda]
MIIGLTGGIGVGKSFVANCFKKLGAVVFDADFVVHQLYTMNKNLIRHAEKKFPIVVINSRIDRAVLSKYFISHDKNWKKFQFLVHSAVRDELEFFITCEKRINNKKILILDIPLLLETRFYLYCNFIVLVHADSIAQDQRLSERNINKEKLDLILNIQLPFKEKRKMSNFIVNTSTSKEHVFSQVKDIVDSLNPRA